MDLPKVDERQYNLDNAALKYDVAIRKAKKLHADDKLDIGDMIKSYHQIITNLLLDPEEKVTHNEFQKEVEKMLEELRDEYQLTLGEQMILLARVGKRSIDVVLEWEKKGIN